MKTKEDLLKDYIKYHLITINEYSGDISSDYKSLLSNALEYARDLNIKWNNNYLPAHVWETIQDEE